VELFRFVSIWGALIKQTSGEEWKRNVKVMPYKKGSSGHPHGSCHRCISSRANWTIFYSRNGLGLRRLSEAENEPQTLSFLLGLMNWRKLALFLSGLFFGGAIDHVILALKNSSLTPYGLHLGVIGNWVLATLDLVLAAILFALHRFPEVSKDNKALR